MTNPHIERIRETNRKVWNGRLTAQERLASRISAETVVAYPKETGATEKDLIIARGICATFKMGGAK